jgi:ParB family chromosome partitioning protein
MPELTLTQLIVPAYVPLPNLRPDQIDAIARDLSSGQQHSPLVVRQIDEEGDKYEVLYGIQYLQAAIENYLSKITFKADVRELGDLAAFTLANDLAIAFVNPDPCEQARAYNAARDHLSLKVKNMAVALGMKRSTLSNFMRIDTLTPIVKGHVRRGEISVGHAIHLASLPPKQQEEFASKTIREKLSTTNLYYLTREDYPDEDTLPDTPQEDPLQAQYAAHADQLSDILQCETTVKRTKDGGALHIRFHSLEQLRDLVSNRITPIKTESFSGAITLPFQTTEQFYALIDGIIPSDPDFDDDFL